MVKSFPQEGGKSAVECKVRRATASEPCNPSRAGSIGLPRMNADQAALFHQALNCKQIRRKSNNWVEACCPLAPWTHQKRSGLAWYSPPLRPPGPDPGGRAVIAPQRRERRRHAGSSRRAPGRENSASESDWSGDIRRVESQALVRPRHLGKPAAAGQERTGREVYFSP